MALKKSKNQFPTYKHSSKQNFKSKEQSLLPAILY
jgi:hypothetical protein